ncbi:hypothetical protein E2C01_091826 [Portunus trituberculatus]|uniref:Uncharacterized protein n=1 Tax=Portunus trituberculatus TaxID=210409 RepID=A0A5B7JK23_PORTR|nr:hypothetical protein [Portunus trituberculatus]
MSLDWNNKITFKNSYNFNWSLWKVVESPRRRTAIKSPVPAPHRNPPPLTPPYHASLYDTHFLLLVLVPPLTVSQRLS